MAIPTVNVTILVLDPTTAAPVVGATVTARLNAQDQYQGQIIPRDTINGVTDANGSCVMPLFPNALGEIQGDFCQDGSKRNTSYAFTVKSSTGKILYRTVATVPNQNVNLTAIAGNSCNPQTAVVPPQTGFHDGEIPVGVIDGNNKIFTLAAPPNPPSSLTLYLNGVLQTLNTDYALAFGNQIRYLIAGVPALGDKHICWYRA